ncbi:MAG: carboxypeptidase regulatory-like domain-containing protein [Pyrinomonadaceae bacterium]
MRQTFLDSLRIALAGFVVLLCAVTVSAQFRAGIQGSVTDETGAVVPGATVTLLNNETSRSQQVTTSDEGFYRFSSLAPGTYTITVEQANFKKQVLDNVAISAEDVQGLDIALSAGGVAETVTVTDTVAGLDTETANIRGLITTEEIRQLPQVGRNPYELARTAPGVFGDTARGGASNTALFIPGVEMLGGGSNSGAFQTENQTQITANGQRVSSNNYQIDGVSVNSLGLGGAAVVTPNQESVKEVSVVSTSFSAEDGRNTGAQIKVVSQNGTNDFHGSAVINYASPKLNSFNQYFGPTIGEGSTPASLTCQRGVRVFASRCPEIVDRFERKFAGSLGGPVYLPRFGEGGPKYFSGKNRLFFFFSYEGLRRSTSRLDNIFIETPEFRDYVASVRPGGFANRLFNTAGVTPTRVVTTGLPSGGPNGPNRAVNGRAGLSFDIGSITTPLGQNIIPGVFDGIPDVTFASVAVPESLRGNQYNTRIDFNRGDKDQFAVSTYFTKLDNFAGSTSGRPFEDLTFAPFNSAATFTYIRTISSTLLNEARFNFTRFNANELDALGSGDLSIPRLQIQGFGDAFTFGGPPSFGINRGTPNNRTQNTYEFRDTVTLVRGNQAIKAGVEVRREQNNNNEISGARPEFVFTNFLNFANDHVFFQNIDVDPRTGGAANGQRYFRSNTYALFVQDDWKFRPNLTLNLGLRYEYQTPLTEKEGRLTNFQLGPNGVVDGRIITVERLYNPDRNNFGPRLGFAYSPNLGESFGGLLGENRAVIRGGFGIFYDRIFQNQLANVRGNPPFFARAGLFNPSDADNGPIIYSFALGGNPFVYPANPNLQRGIDPLTGGLLAPNPTTLPGGFIRRDIPVEVNGTPEDLPNAYVYSYSLELQYQLTRQIVASASYQGSAGRKLIRTVNINRLSPGDTFDNNFDCVQTRDVNGNPVTPRLTCNPNFYGFENLNGILFALPDVNSNYNALLLRVSSNYARNFQIEGNYRFSKSIDTSSFGRGAQQTEPSNPQLERGPSDFDIKHNLVVSGLYRIPFFNDGRGLLGKLLGGFEINGILSAHSGFPFTPVVFGDVALDLNGDAFRPDRPTRYFGGVVENPSNQDFINGIFPGANGRLPGGAPGGTRFFDITTRGAAGIGRNSFRGPSYRSIDLSIVKQTKLPFINEQANLDLRANLFNAFNLLNLPPFQPVTSRVDIGNTGDFGRATSALAGRVIELQARFSF